MNLLTPYVAKAADLIEVTHEVLLENGKFPVPSALIRTAEGDYVVAGMEENRPWAIRTDSKGEVRWRYELPRAKQKTTGSAAYASAAAMSNEGTVLCGYSDVGETTHPIIVGILTVVNKAGEVVKHQELYPNSDTRFRLNYLHKCIPWGDGFAVIGRTSRWIDRAGDRIRESFYWLLALDARGEIKWEKLIGNPAGSLPGSLIQMPNNDILLTLWNGHALEIIRMAMDGSTKAESSVGDSRLVHGAITEDSLHFISTGAGTTMQTLNGKLSGIGSMKGNADLCDCKALYRRSDGSIVAFGYQREDSVRTAAIVALSADLNERQVFLFRPLWTSGEVADAVPADSEGEFATIRTVRRLPMWPKEVRVGLVIGFVRVN